MSSRPGYSVLFRRSAANPILTARDWPYPVHTVFNPGAARLADGSTLLLCRAEDRRGFSHLCAARSHNGVDSWEVDRAPTLLGSSVDECWGIEDPRITYIPELSAYVVAYTGFTKAGPGVCLAQTKDFQSFTRMGLVMQADDKDAALLPHRIHGKFALIHRPTLDTGAHIWMSFSPDLRNWGGHEMVLEARKGAWWDAHKVGLSTPLIETSSGWLMLYHGVRHTASGCLYRMGLALLSSDDPTRCILRGDSWVFGPEASYECLGDVNNVVFPCGYTLGDDEDTLYLYYGAADTCICMATASVRELLEWLLENGQRGASTLRPLQKDQSPIE